MRQYLVQVVTSSPAVADALLKTEEYDSTCTGGIRDLRDGSFAIHAVLEDRHFPVLRRTHGVLRLEVLADLEENRLARLEELMGRPAF